MVDHGGLFHRSRTWNRELHERPFCLGTKACRLICCTVELPKIAASKDGFRILLTLDMRGPVAGIPGFVMGVNRPVS
jgi:hypothetical protein